MTILFQVRKFLYIYIKSWTKWTINWNILDWMKSMESESNWLECDYLLQNNDAMQKSLFGDTIIPLIRYVIATLSLFHTFVLSVLPSFSVSLSDKQSNKCSCQTEVFPTKQLPLSFIFSHYPSLLLCLFLFDSHLLVLSLLIPVSPFFSLSPRSCFSACVHWMLSPPLCVLWPLPCAVCKWFLLIYYRW